MMMMIVTASDLPAHAIRCPRATHRCTELDSDTQTPCSCYICLWCVLVYCLALDVLRAQFLASGCKNCPFLDMANDSERVKDCTTPYFQGLISLIDPAGSWAGKWLRLTRRAAGCYAVRLVAELPEHIEDILRDNGIPYNPDE